MPKKSRRTKAKDRAKPAKATRRYSQQTKLTAKPELPAKIKIPPQIEASRYEYIMPELRYIGILAGAIIVALIVLSFILG
jgi:hypothetical protein